MNLKEVEKVERVERVKRVEIDVCKSSSCRESNNNLSNLDKNLWIL
jgi:hypothetical protein